MGRNIDGIQFEKLRKKIDTDFNEAHDALEDAYYNHWRQGNSKSWQNYDVQKTPGESKTLFDKLHGLIWLHYQKTLHEENQKQPTKDKYDEAKYDLINDREGKTIGRKSDKAIAEIDRLKTEGIEITIKKLVGNR